MASDHRPSRRSATGPGDSVVLSVIVLTLTLASLATASEISFTNDVMAVLSKAGCNQGVCHGNKSGKGGFKLSLRGQDPRVDYAALTHSPYARRVNHTEPDESLILLKPATRLPHEGGRRFAVDSEEYDILRRWIAAGTPADGELVDGSTTPRLEELAVTPQSAVVVEPRRELELQVTARFSDGSSRDVTSMVVYEQSTPMADITHDGHITGERSGETTVLVRYLHLQVPVRLTFVPERPDFRPHDVPSANYVDRHIFRKLNTLRIEPSELATDREFLRRATLDLAGRWPAKEEARAFLSDTRPEKRSLLIDRLLQSPDFADFWALKWSDLLRNEEKVLDNKGVQNFHRWIRHGIATGKPVDVFVREIIAARGSTYTRPEANYYRALRDPVSRAESTAQVFLGTRLQCAKCHNHPFDRWTQDDYYGWTSLFARVRYKILDNRRRDRNDKHEFKGEQIVWMDRSGTVKDPRTGRNVRPRFLGEETPEFDAERDPLEELAEWVTRPDNPYFARAQVNRIWYHLMGRGLVDPIDDFRATNPPTHPELLDELTEDFVAHGFDLRHMIRRIMSSRAYGLSAIPNASNRSDEANYSHALVARLSAEQLLDSLAQVLNVPLKFNGYPEGLRAAQVPGVNAVRLRDRSPSRPDQFLRLFGRPPRLMVCECERSTNTTLGQAFQLISGPLMQDLLTRSGNRIDRLVASDRKDCEIVEELYWTTLSRPPTRVEAEAARDLLESSEESRRRALEDLTWGLVNSKEFLLRH